MLVDVADGKVRAEVTRKPAPNTDPSFSPDGKFLAVVREAPGQAVVFYEGTRVLGGGWIERAVQGAPAG